MKQGKEKIRDIFAGNVRKYRILLNYSQEYIAEKAGISVQMIKGIEGNKTWVSDKTVGKLAKSLNLEEYQLFLPERKSNSKYYGVKSFKGLINLKKKTEDSIKEIFEKAVKSGDFS